MQVFQSYLSTVALRTTAATQILQSRISLFQSCNSRRTMPSSYRYITSMLLIHVLGQSFLDQKIAVSLFCGQIKNIHAYFATWCILETALLSICFWVPKLMDPLTAESTNKRTAHGANYRATMKYLKLFGKQVCTICGLPKIFQKWSCTRNSRLVFLASSIQNKNVLAVNATDVTTYNTCVAKGREGCLCDVRLAKGS